MKIIVNEEEVEIEQDSSVANLLSMYELNIKKIAVEINLKVLPKSLYNSHKLQSGDCLEIIQFVGGG